MVSSRGADVGGHFAGRAAEGVGVDRHLAGQVAPVDLVGAGALAHLRHLVQPHDARAAVGVGAGGEGQALQVLRRVAGVGRQAHVHVVGLVVRRAPVAHGLAGHQRAQGRGDLRHGQAQVGGGVAPHVDVDHRLVGLDAGVQVDQAGDGRGCFSVTSLRQALQLLQVGALQRKLHLLVAADGVEQADVRHGDAGHLLAAARAARRTSGRRCARGPCGPPGARRPSA